MGLFGANLLEALWPVWRDHGVLRSVTLTVRGTPVLDVTTGAITHASSSQTLDGRLGQYRREEIDGTAVVVGDRWAHCRATDILGTPGLTWQATIEGQLYAIIAVEATNAGAGWKLQLRTQGEV